MTMPTYITCFFEHLLQGCLLVEGVSCHCVANILTTHTIDCINKAAVPMQADHALNRLLTLKERTEATESLARMHLAQRRNELVSFDLMLTVIAINVALTGGSFIAAVRHCICCLAAILVTVQRSPTAVFFVHRCCCILVWDESLARRQWRT